ncbi:PAS domain-containing protein [Nostoc sp. FACHB-888]|uniref:PAS domain-containing protein n=1 Tax=Nostoc sp. FACHB-888 TaxID=2692842 RepID=UPI001687015B|nr:PAS domain-containing protein [Nostoc sp. FACHB-888]MBD2248646.1 PAS domain-containing protein [Nostoc sp. FACHB-888]
MVEMPLNNERQLKEEHKSLAQAYEAVSQENEQLSIEQQERQRVEENLRQSEARLQLALDAAEMGTFVWDIQNDRTELDARMLALFGLPTDSTLDLREALATLIHPDERTGYACALACAIDPNGDGALRQEIRVVHSDGAVRWLAITGQTFFETQPRRAVRMSGIAADISDRKRAEAALRSSEEQLRLFITASSDIVYKMSADWSEMRYLEGKNFLASIDNSSGTWLEQYVPTEDQPQVRAAIRAAVRTKSTFELEHRVIQRDGTLGWTFSRAIPLLNAQHEIVEWLGAASDVTQRKQAQLNAEFLATVTQNLIEATSVDDILQTVGEQLNRYLKTSRCAFIKINERTNEAVVQDDWYQEDVPSLVGVYRLLEFLTEEFFQIARTGNPIVVRDVSTDARIANQERFAALKIGSFINVPLIRDGEWKFTLGVYHQEQYNWRTDEIELMRELANRIWTMLSRTYAEAALRESEQRFRVMADAVPQIVWITDAEGRVEFFNKQWSNYTGVPYEPTTAAQVAANFVHPEDGERTMAAFNEARRTSSVFSVEHRIRSAAGTYRWFLVRAEPYQNLQTGEIIRWFGASVDIHARKQAEATILQREAQFRQLADAMPQQVWISDAQGNTQYVNQQWTTYTGLTLEQTQDIHASTEIIHPDDFESTSQLWSTALATGSPYQAEFRLKYQADHTYRWFLSRAIAIRDEQGQIVQWFGTGTDIDAFRRAQAQREQLLQREQTAREVAENANRIKDEFLAVLSHELRSPLNPILGWTQLLQNGKLDAARQREALAIIERNAKLQTQLIEDLLDFSRIIQGKLSLTVIPVSLTFVISAAVEIVRLAAEAKNIEIVLDLAPESALVSGDVARLQQVVWNLLTNAVKFTPNGGQVSVELRQLDGLAQIRVIDTGKGINPQFLPYVFEYFRQEDGSTTRKFGGLGLGLAIVRQIVEMHGGTVLVESFGEGQGATFIVQLPTMQQISPIAPQPIGPQAETGLPLAGIQILLVDDEPDTREFQTFVLEQSGATVTAVASGLEALQALEQSIPDLLVSDIGMPQMDGYMLIEKIRALPSNLGGMIPAIALTAYATETDQQRALQVGFQTHITKPVEPEQLVRAIAVLLEGFQTTILP